MHISPRQARQANLLGALGLAVSDRLRGALTDEKVGLSAAAALIHVRLRPGQTIDFLAHVLGISHPAAVRLVDRLEEDALLERRPARDGRARALVLTRAGEAVATRILAQRALFLAGLLAPLSAPERRQLEALLEKLLASAVDDRWQARHVCRLCDFAICADPACPVDAAAGDEEAVAVAATTPAH